MSDHSTHTHQPCGCLLPAPIPQETRVQWPTMDRLNQDLNTPIPPRVARDEGRRRAELEEAAIAWHRLRVDPYCPKDTPAWRASVSAAEARLDAAVAALLGD